MLNIARPVKSAKGAINLFSAKIRFQANRVMYKTMQVMMIRPWFYLLQPIGTARLELTRGKQGR